MAQKEKKAQDPSRKAAILERRATVNAIRNSGNSGINEKQMPAVQAEAKGVAAEQVETKKAKRGGK